VKLDYFGYKGDVGPFVEGINHLEATLSPYYRTNGERWNLQLGVNAMLITGDSSWIFASPNIAADVQVGKRTQLYVSAGGQIQSNDVHGGAQVNRYIDFYREVLPARTWLDATVGIRSGITPDVWLNVFAGYKITENDVFFVPSYRSMITSIDGDESKWANDFVYSGVFQPDASAFQVGAELKYSYRKWLDLSLKGVYHSWTLKEGDFGNYGMEPEDMKPYGRPAVDVNVDVVVKPLEPLTLTLGYYLGADRYTRLTRYNDMSGFLDENVKMKNLNDLNLTASWNINDTFGAYLKLNNLLFQKQELFYGHPLQGFNAMVGININF
jgi:hypothetical protein